MRSDTPNPPDNFPAWKYDFVQEALDSSGVVTEIDEKRYGHAYHAALDIDGQVWMATIETDNGENLDRDEVRERVTFRECRPGHELHVLHSWSTVAVKALHGPDDLDSWRSIFECFEAALGLYESHKEGDDV